MTGDYRELEALLREAAVLFHVENLLAWDQEVMMPEGGGAFRAEQVALLGRLTHEHSTLPRIGELIAACRNDPELAADPAIAANLRELARRFERASRLPASLVAEAAETGSRAVEAWREARAESDFRYLRPWLERQIELARAMSVCWGTPAGGEAYDAWIEEHEPGLCGADLDRIFQPLRTDLVALIQDLAGAGRLDDPLYGLRLPVADQRRFHRHVLDRIGFDETRGRFDVSTHPFSTSVGPRDTRLTTRFGEDEFLDGLFATLHEAGHALYEQGRPLSDYPGQPLSEHASLGMHESQSRLWENHVGRSQAFWVWAQREAGSCLGQAIAAVAAEELYRSANLIRPTPIRVRSDEATYNLHVMLRFDLERAMFRGDLTVADLPGAWNDRMRDDLGITVTRDADGCLQDMHWARGAFGYFPSYTLGNLYAAQLWEALVRDRPDAEGQMARGDFGPVLGWLRARIHAHGRRFPAAELLRRATGKDLSHRPLLDHLERKLRATHDLELIGAD